MPNNRISTFDTEWAPLSNFAYSPFEYQGYTYPTVEHAYQSLKCDDTAWAVKVRMAKTPGEAKHLGNAPQAKKIAEWDEVKVMVMHNLVLAKFSTNRYLADLLVSTGDAHLEEGNTWGDKFWGTVNGEGKNMLGEILMHVRAELKKIDSENISDSNPTYDLVQYTNPLIYK